MNAGTWIAVYLPFIILFFILMQRKKALKHHTAAKLHKRKGGAHIMQHIIEKYMGKGVRITTVNDTHLGFLSAYEDGWITLTYEGKDTELNADYIVQMEAHDIPEKKRNGKQKSPRKDF